MLEYFCVLPFFRCCQDGSQEKEANSPWNLVSNVSYLPSCAPLEAIRRQSMQLPFFAIWNSHKTFYYSQTYL